MILYNVETKYQRKRYIGFQKHNDFLFLQDASRMVIAEYDPTGEREQVERSVVKAPLF